MKILKTNVISLSVLISLLLGACSSPIKEEHIEACKQENEGFKKQSEQMDITNKKLTLKQEARYSEMMASVDPKKKKLFAKNEQLLAKISEKRQQLKTLDNKHRILTDSVKSVITENDSFIIALPKGDVGIKEADSKWSANKQKLNEYWASEENLLKEIEVKQNDLNMLYDLVSAQYGKTQKKTKKHKKSL